MDSPDPSDAVVVATEDVVDTLIDFLVGPLLPAKSSSRVVPSTDLQQSVAKQMHAVVLLYNYYHRKQFPQLEFLDFESFCKVAINSKPDLLVYMKCNVQHDNSDKRGLVTAKAVMDACNICMRLEASKDGPSLQEWPISKVVVFLTDSTEQNCLLQMSNITQGVWSLIEKNYDDCCGRTKVFKKKKVTKRPLEDQFSACEARLKKVAVLAVEEKTGAAQKDILLLESHTSYSLSEERKSARFYIMKISKAINEDIIQVPISDAIDSLQGPLVKKSFGTCMVTPVVEYFHLLPYARIIAQWYSRKMLPNDLLSKAERKTDMNMDFLLRSDVSCIETHVENTEKSHATNQSATIVNIMEGNNTEKVNHKKNITDCFGNHSDANFGCHIKVVGKTTMNMDSSQRNDASCIDMLVENTEKLHSNKSATTVNITEGNNSENANHRENRSDCFGNYSDANHGCHIWAERETDMNMDYSLRHDMSCIETSVEIFEKSHATNQRAPIVNTMEGNNTEKVHHKENNSDYFDNCSDANHGCHTKGEAGSSAIPLLTNQQRCSLENYSSVKDKAEVVDLRSHPCNDNSTEVNAADENYLLCNQSSEGGRIVKDHLLVPSQSKTKCVNTTQAMILMKRNELLQTLCKVLLDKRNELSHQLRHQMDELARFENNLQTIFNGGGDNLMLMIESVVDGCNTMSTIDATLSHMEKHSPSEEKHSTVCFKKRRLSEAILHLSNTCQELDNICSENNWVLPQYNVFPSDGGFTARVTVRGADFECSDCGDARANPREGRESAAACVLGKLRSMVN